MHRTLCIIAMAMASIGLLGEGQRSIYDSAVKQYEAKQYEQSCGTLKQLYEASNKFQNLESSIISTEKSSLVRGFDWQNKAFFRRTPRTGQKSAPSGIAEP